MKREIIWDYRSRNGKLLYVEECKNM